MFLHEVFYGTSEVELVLEPILPLWIHILQVASSGVGWEPIPGVGVDHILQVELVGSLFLWS